MSTISLCIGLNSSVCDLSFVVGTNVTTVQVGDLCVSNDMDSYIQGFLLQVNEIDKYNLRKALLLPAVAPGSDQGTIERIILAACEAGVDEIIANSLGEIRTVRRLGVEVALTASDFVCCYCMQDALVLKDYGVNRVRLSPEMSFAQVSALASKTPLDLQVIVHGCITLGVLQEFSRVEVGADCNLPLTVCAENGGEALFQIHGAEIVSKRCLDLLRQITDFEKVGVYDFFIDARFLDYDNIVKICATYGKSSTKLTRVGDDTVKIGLTEESEAIRAGYSFCNGWFHGKPGIGVFR